MEELREKIFDSKNIQKNLLFKKRENLYSSIKTGGFKQLVPGYLPIILLKII